MAPPNRRISFRPPPGRAGATSTAAPLFPALRSPYPVGGLGTAGSSFEDLYESLDSPDSPHSIVCAPPDAPVFLSESDYKIPPASRSPLPQRGPLRVTNRTSADSPFSTTTSTTPGSGSRILFKRNPASPGSKQSLRFYADPNDDVFAPVDAHRVPFSDPGTKFIDIRRRAGDRASPTRVRPATRSSPSSVMGGALRGSVDSSPYSSSFTSGSTQWEQTLSPLQRQIRREKIKPKRFDQVVKGKISKFVKKFTKGLRGGK